MIQVSDVLNDDYAATGSITVKRRKLFDKSTKICALGSCFARETRRALTDLGYDIYPKFKDIELGPGEVAGRLPEVDNIHHYTPQTICQEIDRIFSRRQFDELWYAGWPKCKFGKAWVTPYFRGVYGETEEAARSIRDKIFGAISEGVRAADVVIVTFGLTEAWRDKTTEKWVQYDVSDGLSENVILETDMGGSIEWTFQMLREMGKLVVTTVSPIPLRRTFTGEDVVVANMTSKAAIRSAVGRACRADKDLVYWPSYEHALAHPEKWLPDRRHLKPEAVDEIVEAFVEVHG